MDHVVQSIHADLAVLHGCFEGRPEVGAIPHFHIKPRIGGGHRAMRRAPIGHHETGKAPLLIQGLVEQEGILARVDGIHHVVRAHHRACSALLNCRLESRQVNLVQGSFINLRVHAPAIIFLVVRGEMLDRGNHPLRLDALDFRRRELTRQVRIFAQALEAPAPFRIAQNIDGRPKHHVGPFARLLTAKRLPILIHERSIPTCRASNRSRKGRYLSLAIGDSCRTILQIKSGNAQARNGRDISNI